MENKVIVKGLKKSFGNLEVLKGMDVEVKDGEVVCLIGPSGSGKSTFLRCLNRLESITGARLSSTDLILQTKIRIINKVRENIGIGYSSISICFRTRR